jgi:hypothetical protein
MIIDSGRLQDTLRHFVACPSGRLTADIRLRFAPPKCSASPRTSYVRRTLSEIALRPLKDEKFIKVGTLNNKGGK